MGWQATCMVDIAGGLPGCHLSLDLAYRKKLNMRTYTFRNSPLKQASVIRNRLDQQVILQFGKAF